ncbi:leucine-rich repeat domain-containing protein [Candidatus Lokiarchaeum ossiferum]|uniref:leucine-rich repeat domain-containing protein n=1 Tax=Candidatus Lokiarchaeum ossiferum TaxID=2951803 RepID=UPI00352F45BA
MHKSKRKYFQEKNPELNESTLDYLADFYDIWIQSGVDIRFTFSNHPENPSEVVQFTIFGHHEIENPKILTFIQQIPHFFPNLTNIHIVYDFLSELPISYQKLHRLDALIIGGDRFSKLSDFIFTAFPKLETFILNRSSLCNIPNDICRLKKLTYLEIQDLPNLFFLPNSIGKLLHLEELRLIDNNILRLPDTLVQCSSLRKIYLTQREDILYFPPKIKDKLHLLTSDINRWKVYESLRQEEKFTTILQKLMVNPEYILSYKETRILMNSKTPNQRNLLEQYGNHPQIQHILIKTLDDFIVNNADSKIIL